MALLRERGIEPEIVEYLNDPPSKARLKELLTMLGIAPRDLMRKKEKPYKELNLGVETLSDAELIAAMTENPVLIERPIVVKGKKARIGRPPESVLEIV